VPRICVLGLCLLTVTSSSWAQSDKPLLIRHPTISRDKIAFCYAGDLWTVGREGGDAVRLTAGIGEKCDPYYSPDGRWLAYTADSYEVHYYFEWGETKSYGQQTPALPGAESSADGLMPVRPGDLTFEHVREFVETVVTVDDAEIAKAALWLFYEAKQVVEPSGAAGVAAIRSAKAGSPLADKSLKIATILTGGNVTPLTLAELEADGARLREQAPSP